MSTEVSFTSHFGDYLNGLWITWKSTPTLDTGTSDLTIDFKCNLRSRLHIFGYGTDYTQDSDWTALKKPAWYTSSFYDKVANWGVDVKGTDYKSSAPTTTYPSEADIKTGKGLSTTSLNYSVYVAWQNPDVTGAVTYDGFEAKIFYTLTPPLPAVDTTGGAWENEAAMKANPPTLKFEFQDNQTSGLRFDIQPGTQYQSG